MSDPSLLDKPKICQNDSALQGLRVLVVDDDVDSCDFIVMVLEGFGMKPRVAFSTWQAIEAFTQFQPDILVSDIAMPDQDGCALIQQVRSLESDRDKQVPAIAVTALVNEEIGNRVLSAGFQQWLPKPLDIDALVEAMVSLVASADQRTDFRTDFGPTTLL